MYRRTGDTPEKCDVHIGILDGVSKTNYPGYDAKVLLSGVDVIKYVYHNGPWDATWECAAFEKVPVSEVFGDLVVEIDDGFSLEGYFYGPRTKHGVSIWDLVEDMEEFDWIFP